MLKSKGKKEENDPTMKIEKLVKQENGAWKIRGETVIDSSLESIFSILTDYPNMINVIPECVTSEVLETDGARTRVRQVVKKNVALGIKITGKAVYDYHQKEKENLPDRVKRDIDVNLVEGDFQTYVAKWTVEQMKKAKSEESSNAEELELQSIVTFDVEMKPSPWIPFSLLEGKIGQDLRDQLTNLKNETLKRANPLQN